jgi:hypothetical protein
METDTMSASPALAPVEQPPTVAANTATPASLPKRDLTMPVNFLDEAPLLLCMSGPYLVESVLVAISAGQSSYR